MPRDDEIDAMAAKQQQHGRISAGAKEVSNGPMPPALPAWSWIRILAFGPFTPARAGLASDHLAFWKLLLVHLTAMLTLWPIAELSFLYADPDREFLLVSEVWSVLLGGPAMWRRRLLALLALTGFAELGMAASGGLVSPWGARDEP